MATRKGRTMAAQNLEMLLTRTTPRPTSFTRKRRTVTPKPTDLDDIVLETYNEETPLEMVVPRWATDGTLRMLRKSVRFLEENTGHEMRLKVQTEDTPNGKTKVKFLAHPPLERGRRVSRK